MGVFLLEQVKKLMGNVGGISQTLVLGFHLKIIFGHFAWGEFLSKTKNMPKTGHNGLFFGVIFFRGCPMTQINQGL